MTTILVDYKDGLVMTDSRVTVSKGYWIRLFNRTVLEWSKETQTKICNQKAIFLHDRLFTGAGDSDDISHLLSHLALGVKLELSSDANFTALLIDKNWILEFNCNKGIMKKKLRLLSKENWLTIGSGKKVLASELNAITSWSPKSVMKAFGRVTLRDKYTDDNLNIYKI